MTPLARFIAMVEDGNRPFVVSRIGGPAVTIAQSVATPRAVRIIAASRGDFA